MQIHDLCLNPNLDLNLNLYGMWNLHLYRMQNLHLYRMQNLHLFVTHNEFIVPCLDLIFKGQGECGVNDIEGIA